MFKSLFKSSKPTAYQNLSNEDFRSGSSGPKAVILDVRTPAEYAQGHIPGAKNINVMDPSFSGKVGKLDPSMDYYVYCRSGGRSGSACKMLTEMGFTQVSNLTYGMNGWDGEVE